MIENNEPFSGDISLEDIQKLEKSEKKQQVKQKTPAKKEAKTVAAPAQKAGTTMTGQPADQVVINPDSPPILEAKESTAVMAFGRFNPPTVGHEKLIHKVEDVAKEHGGTPHIVASHSEGTQKDPLPQDKKIGYLHKVADKDTKVMGSSKQEPSILHAAANLHNQGHKHLVVVAGSDRVAEYHKMLTKYNNVPSKHGHYNFKSIKVVSAGHRDPDAEGVEGMSGTKMREHAKSGNHEEFKSGLPKALQPHAKEMIKHISSIKEDLSEALSMQQRLRRAVTMKRNAKKLEAARRIARKRLAKAVQMRRRALKRARAVIRTRIAGQRGTNYNKLTVGDKIAVDRLADKRKKQIIKMANRLAPRVKRDDINRLASIARGKQIRNAPTPLIASYEIDGNKTLTEKAAIALKQKAHKAGIEFEAIVEVFARGIKSYPSDSTLTPQQYAFARVNSFLSNGKAAEEDADLLERKTVQYTARDMTNVDVENLPKVHSFSQHSVIKAEIEALEKEDKLKAARKKAELIRRATGEMNRKIIEAKDSSVFTRAANKIVRRQSPQLAMMKERIVAALKKKDYDTVANVILYLAKEKLAGGKRVQQENVCVPEEDYIYEEWTEEQWNTLVEENNEGRALNKPFRTPGGPKKFAVYVKNDKGNVIKLGFGDPNLEIKRDDPDRRKAYRARHGCDNPGPKWKANYWSCNWSWSASKKVGA
jgi:hypothetical protein